MFHVSGGSLEEVTVDVIDLSEPIRMPASGNCTSGQRITLKERVVSHSSSSGDQEVISRARAASITSGLPVESMLMEVEGTPRSSGTMYSAATEEVGFQLSAKHRAIIK